jgi:hypothetical protein
VGPAVPATMKGQDVKVGNITVGKPPKKGEEEGKK